MLKNLVLGRSLRLLEIDEIHGQTDQDDHRSRLDPPHSPRTLAPPIQFKPVQTSSNKFKQVQNDSRMTTNQNDKKQHQIGISNWFAAHLQSQILIKFRSGSIKL
jgi:hypothetical protein